MTGFTSVLEEQRQTAQSATATADESKSSARPTVYSSHAPHSERVVEAVALERLVSVWVCVYSPSAA